MSKLCPKCGCCLAKEREEAFRRVYLSTGSSAQAARTMGMSKDWGFDWRQKLRLPKFPREFGPRFTWRPEEEAELARMIGDGVTRTEAIQLLGRGEQSILNRRRALGLPPFKRPSTKKNIAKAEQVCALRLAGFSYRQVAAKLGITRNAVAGIIRDYIKPRLQEKPRHENALPNLRAPDRPVGVGCVRAVEHCGADGPPR